MKKMKGISSMKKLLFVFNPFAGKGLIKSNLYEIIDVFTKGGYNVTCYPTQAPLDGFEKIRKDASYYDLVVVSGGDGTLSEGVKGMMEQDEMIPLGYIPAGSTNDFAKSMGIPAKMTVVAENIMNGVYFDYDIGEFNGEYYVYVAAFGAFTDVAYSTSQNAKNVFGHMAYIAEALKRLPTYTGYDLIVEHDDTILHGNFILGIISNTISIGGMKKLIHGDVCFDDGLFEVTLVRTPTNAIAFQSLITDATFNKLTDKNFVTFRTSKVKITSDIDIAWTLDGESGGSHREVEINNIKQAIRFVIPPDEKTNEQMLLNSLNNDENDHLNNT